MFKKNGKNEEQSSYGAKLALTAGSLSSLYLLPFAAQATLHFGGNLGPNPTAPTPSLSFNGTLAGEHSYWDVDGDGNNDFSLLRGIGQGGAPGRRIFLSSNGLNGAGILAPNPSRTLTAAGNSQQPMRLLGGIVALNGQTIVGPTAGANRLWGISPASGGGMPVYRTVLFRNQNNNGAVIGGGVNPNKLVGFQAGNNYFGFRFLSNGRDVYGWGNLFISGLESNAAVAITQWAWDDEITSPDARIPEPSTAALALIGLGAGGVRAWRARKNAAKAEALTA